MSIKTPFFDIYYNNPAEILLIPVKKGYTFPILKHYEYDLNRAWYVEFYEHGEQQRIASGKKFGIVGEGNRLTKLGQRKQYFKDLVAAIIDFYSEKEKIPEVVELKKTPTCLAALELWLAAKKLEGLAKPTLEDYRGRCMQFLTKMDLLELPCTAITQDQIKTYLTFHEENSPTHYNHFISKLMNWCNWLVAENYFSKNPVIGIKNRMVTITSNVAYNIIEAKRVLLILKERAPLVWLSCLFEYYCFMRPNEIEQLRWQDLDLGRCTVTVWAVSSKVKTIRTLPVHKDLVAAIKLFKSWQQERLGEILETDWVFIHPKTREKVAYKYCSNRFKYLSKELDLPPRCTFYAFKHTGCIALYRATKDIYLVSKLCGHSNITTTQKYLRSLGEDVDYLDSSALDSVV